MTYDNEWHRTHGDRTTKSARLILGSLREAVHLDNALDVGCGDGRWLEVWREQGDSSVTGIDGPWNNTSMLRFPKENFLVKDFRQPFDLGRRFDLVISLEVAEHIPTESALGFVQSLTRHADCVLFSAAIPYSGGYRHLNERWQSWWAELFDAQGYDVLDPFRPIVWGSDDVHYWYQQNTLLYISRERQDLKDALNKFMVARSIKGFPVDIVHPKKYERSASYAQIDFSRFLRQLPVVLWRRAKQAVRSKLFE